MKLRIPATLCFLLSLALSSAQAEQSTACTSEPPAYVLTCFELVLESPVDYAHPIKDLTLSVTYTLPDTGSQMTVLAFWDGGHTYRARVALPAPGVWKYQIIASDISNDLNGRNGTVEVLPYTGNDLFRLHGWLRVSENQRYLTYGDGTPFFWLSDTAWEMPRASYPEQIDPYIDDRLAKGFTMTSMVVNSHGYFYPYHIKNSLGEPFLLNNDRSMPNPRYFDHLDTIVGAATEKGLGVALVPLWATYAEAHHDTTPWGGVDLYSLEEALVIAEYVGARYAGSNVVWIVAGDQRYDTEEKRAFWDAFARRLDEASGGKHLMTVHPGGYTGSFDGWPSAPEWLDFHMYQGSHIADIRYNEVGPDGRRLEDPYGGLLADGSFHWGGGLRGYHLDSTTPILSAESNYEGLFSRFWELAGDTTNGQRIRTQDVRHAAYWSLLSGSTVGFTYGANGVWQWANMSEIGNLYPLQTPMEALAFPGAAQMGVMRTFAEQNHWYRWVPCPDRVIEVDTRHFVPAACDGNQMVVYLPTGSRRVLVFPTARSVSITWTNPVTGVRWSEEEQFEMDELALSPPDTLDWLVTLHALYRPENSDPEESNQDPPISLTHAGQNPTDGYPQVILLSNAVREIQLHAFDVQGRRVYDQLLTVHSGPNQLVLPLGTSGTYFVRVTYRDSLDMLRTAHLSVTVTPF